MKKKLFFLSALLLLSASTYSQSSDKKWAIGVNTGLSDYHGEVNQKWFNISDYRASLGLTGGYYINPWLNTGLDLSYGSVGHSGPNNGGTTTANLFQAHAQLRLKINNGKWLPEDSRFQPYVYLGTGLAHFAQDKNRAIAPGMDWTGNGGLGINIMATDWLGFNYNLNYTLTSTDRRDSQINLENDQYIIHSIGAVFLLGKKKDMDGDGVADSKDDCPNTSGLSSFNGCPDTDGDGVADKDDKCPTVAGDASNNGCPIVEQETKQLFEEALHGVHFETGKDVILEDSHKILDKIAVIMSNNKSYKLSITGHTDNTGDDALNMELSQKRATSVKNYLINKGVSSTRLEAKGLGETQPKVSNDTPEGRAENRRVEFVIGF